MQAASLFATSGLLGEIPAMLLFSIADPSLEVEAAGRCAMFLFLDYAALLARAAWLSANHKTSTA